MPDADGILKALMPPLSFIPVRISLFKNIVSIKYGRLLPVHGDNEANQVTASSLMQNQAATTTLSVICIYLYIYIEHIFTNLL